MDFQSFSAQPKGELHVHLEGSYTPERALELAAEKDHPWSGLSVDALKARLKTPNFPAFIEQFMLGYRLLRTPAHFQAVTEDLCASLEQMGVVYAEVLYSPGVYVQRMGRRIEDIHGGIEAGLAHFPKLKTRFILDTVLNLGPEFMQRTLELTLADRREFLGGFSVGGGDANLDMRDFLFLFHQASEAGLFCVAHAGEVDGPDNIRVLIEETDVKRIAHGCNAVKDVDLLRLMRDRGIIVDVSLTSNICTGVIPDLDHHPLPVFLEHQVPVTLNTDDPFYFGTDLWREYVKAHERLHIPWSELRAMMDRSLLSA